MLQVEKNHYSFSRYVNKSRWFSYFHQIDEILKSNLKSVLVVGIGDGIVPVILRQILESDYKKSLSVYTFDFDESLNPSFAGDLLDIKDVVRDSKFDCILCCQVLEHLEYKYIDKILSDCSSIAKKLIISIPYSHQALCGISIKLPKGKRIMINLKFPRFYKNFKFDGEHYWELGTRMYSKKHFQDILKKYFIITNRFHAYENPYHLFYVLESK